MTPEPGTSAALKAEFWTILRYLGGFLVWVVVGMYLYFFLKHLTGNEQLSMFIGLMWHVPVALIVFLVALPFVTARIRRARRHRNLYIAQEMRAD